MADEFFYDIADAHRNYQQVLPVTEAKELIQACREQNDTTLVVIGKGSYLLAFGSRRAESYCRKGSSEYDKYGSQKSLDLDFILETLTEGNDDGEGTGRYSGDKDGEGSAMLIAISTGVLSASTAGLAGRLLTRTTSH